MSERKLRAYVDIPTHLGPDVTMNQMITNISLSGCLLITDTHLAVGSTLLLSIPVSGGETLRLKGRVVREHGYDGFGIGFDSMSNEDRRELALLIAETDEGMTQT
jgi:PilZ domain